MATAYKIDKVPLTDEVRAQADGLFVDLPCGNTHYCVEGEGEQWAVLVHGYATPYYIYDKVAAGLVAAGYKVLRYDLLGRGLSERVKADYTPQLFAEQLRQITTAIAGDNSFVLVGTSMGGIITTTYTALYPDTVRRLVLLAPAGMHFAVPLYMRLANVRGLGELMFRAFGGKALAKNCAKEMIVSGQAAKKEYTEKFAYCLQYKGMLRATLSSLRHTILNFEVARQGYDKVAEAGTPVLVIWGTSDKTMPYYQNEEMQKVLPQMQLVTYQGSGHIFLYDEGERTVNDIVRFLQQQ